MVKIRDGYVNGCRTMEEHVNVRVLERESGIKLTNGWDKLETWEQGHREFKTCEYNLSPPTRWACSDKCIL